MNQSVLLRTPLNSCGEREWGKEGERERREGEREGERKGDKRVGEVGERRGKGTGGEVRGEEGKEGKEGRKEEGKEGRKEEGKERRSERGNEGVRGEDRERGRCYNCLQQLYNHMVATQLIASGYITSSLLSRVFVAITGSRPSRVAALILSFIPDTAA